MDRRYKKRMNRYWEKMRKSTSKNISSLDPKEWFDYWHCHIDWFGKGDKHPGNREASIGLGYEVLLMAEHFLESCTYQVQAWWYVHENSYEDAVYLHSENENGTPYPYDFEGVQWAATGNEFLNCLVNLETHKIGAIINKYGTTYVVAKNA